MRRLLKILLCLVILLIVVAIAVPFLIPADKYKDQLLAQIKAKTGRNVSMGHLSFAVFPTLSLDADDVKIGNPAWVPGNLAEIKTLRIGLELMPLLHHEYRLKELVLDTPVITLIQQNGRANWNFGPPPTAAMPQPAAQAAEKSHAGNTGALLANLHLDKISIKNGTLSFKNIAGKTEALSAVNLSLAAPDLTDKAALDFSARYNGKDAQIALTLEKPLAFASGNPTSISLKASYGTLDVAWTGTALLGKDGRPVISGKVSVPTLDVAALSQTQETSAPAAHPAAPQGAAHWSDTPIDLSALGSADGELSVHIGTLKLPQTTLSDIDTSIHLAHGALSTAIGPVKAYGGTLKIDLQASTANAVAVTLSASQAQAEPLLHDFAGYDRLSGTLDMQTQLTASGISQRAMVGSLAGSGSLHFKNGKLKGVDLAGLLRRITAATSDDSGTDFSDLSASFTAAKGIISTNDFQMSSPLLHVTGAGTADLPNWQEHFLLKPAIVASLSSKGSKTAPGIVVPVKVEGPLDHPHYEPDFKGLLQENLKNPAHLKDTVNSLKQQLGKGGLGNLLR